ncbi:hypothetical protein KIL84_004806, partial [Mauremys mutica]
MFKLLDYNGYFDPVTGGICFTAKGLPWGHRQCSRLAFKPMKMASSCSDPVLESQAGLDLRPPGFPLQTLIKQRWTQAGKFGFKSKVPQNEGTRVWILCSEL